MTTWFPALLRGTDGNDIPVAVMPVVAQSSVLVVEANGWMYFMDPTRIRLLQESQCNRWWDAVEIAGWRVPSRAA